LQIVALAVREEALGLEELPLRPREVRPVVGILVVKQVDRV
jgi:hypothetical protein